MGFSIRELFVSAALVSSAFAWVAPENIAPHAFRRGPVGARAYGGGPPATVSHHPKHSGFPTAPQNLTNGMLLYIEVLSLSVNADRNTGNSTLGTIGNPPLGPYANCSVPGGSKPWGNRTTSNTNPYNETTVPDTGMSRARKILHLLSTDNCRRDTLLFMDCNKPDPRPRWSGHPYAGREWTVPRTTHRGELG